MLESRNGRYACRNGDRVTLARNEAVISGWEELGIVVLGSIAAMAIAGLAGWSWDRARRPVLVIESGAGFDFERRVGNSDVAVAPAVEEHQPVAALAKLFRVRETRGHRGAKDVVIRIRDVVPPAPHTTAMVELRWADSSEATSIRPHGHKTAFALLIIFYTTADGAVGWRTTPTVFDHAGELEFTAEVIVAGRMYSRSRFRILNTWENAQIDAYEGHDWPPDHLAYPTIERVTS